MDQKPSIGRVVHFVLSNGPNEGKHRPAFVVEADNVLELVHLHVFTLGAEDGATYAAVPCIMKDVVYSAIGMQGTWHWPEREPTPDSTPPTKK